MTNTVAATLALIALVVGPARAVQPQRMIMHEGLLLGKLSALPPWLSALGVSLVGHEKAQHMVRSMSKVTAISTLGVTVNVTALAKDDTIGRLQKEFANRRDAWGRDCGECDDYGLRHLTSPMPLILDVGGNIGFISSLIARVHPQSQVIAFEPSPVTYFILRINFWLNGVHVLTTEELQGRPKIGGVYPVFGGLGASRAPFEWLEVAGNALAQSQNVNISFGKSGEVPVYHWESFMELHGLTSRTFDLVKLDCECCEYFLVPQVSKWITNRSLVKRLAGELHGPCHAVGETETLSLLRSRGCQFHSRNFLATDKERIAMARLEKQINRLEKHAHELPTGATAQGRDTRERLAEFQRRVATGNFHGTADLALFCHGDTGYLPPP
ncbi:hypothetical protein EMIHUDRAFT_207674 [Emiliania huxleyi CCMP1516]|uniref:Methyltransferase FkbM domain-containing protein n=2 Tax=Emiliania huxleyi TaxID=2903 RepID=A0A0D3JDT9_EMIH1|nr:hypothetical protein EMIHUDRAFT_207674 [Emiliania huxleyi CCMP1516]EOD21674.1 hypothetical protein EMIHUDRAFT_207674 [Emiliania huxleyi CCMP1516]|eukprot:XP_005774103.1 hypothetical protein EMIHUDRAFT_207674 [Emiliania huxleyi CCMP1516]